MPTNGVARIRTGSCYVNRYTEKHSAELNCQHYLFLRALSSCLTASSSLDRDSNKTLSVCSSNSALVTRRVGLSTQACEGDLKDAPPTGFAGFKKKGILASLQSFLRDKNHNCGPSFSNPVDEHSQEYIPLTLSSDANPAELARKKNKKNVSTDCESICIFFRIIRV